MSGDHRSTSNYKKDVLTNNGFSQYRNTTIFLKERVFVLSPAVCRNSQGYYWFDIREKIIQNFDPELYDKFVVIVRIVDVGFLFLTFKDLKKIMTVESKTESSGGKVWSFKIVDNFSKIVNKVSDYDKIDVQKLLEKELVQKLKEL